jgi:hypothetical protein
MGFKMKEQFETIRQLLAELEVEMDLDAVPVRDRDFSVLELPVVIQGFSSGAITAGRPLSRARFVDSHLCFDGFSQSEFGFG